MAKAARIARASAMDGLPHPDIKAFSKLGQKWEHNAWRDCKRVFPDPVMCTASDTIKIPVGHDNGGATWEDVSILYPHRLFATLYHSYLEAFRLHMIGGATSKVSNFWAEMTSHPSYATHPMHGHEFDFREYAIPLKLYGDGTPTTGVGKSWCKLVDGIIMSSLLCNDGKNWLCNDMY